MVSGWEKLEGVTLVKKGKVSAEPDTCYCNCHRAYTITDPTRTSLMGLNLNVDKVYFAYITTLSGDFTVMVFPIKHTLQVGIGADYEKEIRVVFPVTDEMKSSPVNFLTAISDYLEKVPYFFKNKS